MSWHGRVQIAATEPFKGTVLGCCQSANKGEALVVSSIQQQNASLKPASNVCAIFRRKEAQLAATISFEDASVAPLLTSTSKGICHLFVSVLHRQEEAQIAASMPSISAQRPSKKSRTSSAQASAATPTQPPTDP
eukprot:scaffold245217_cov27-Tisochrysis_lutea.AAC.1